MENYNRINGPGGLLGNQNETVEDAEVILENGGKLNENYILQKQTVLKNDLICPDGTCYQKGHVFAQGMMLPKGSVVAKPLEQEEELVSGGVVNDALTSEGGGVVNNALTSEEDEKRKRGWVGKGMDVIGFVPRIGVMGIGGGGCGTIERISDTGIDKKYGNVNLSAVNTAIGDMYELDKKCNVKKALIGVDRRKGLGTGAVPKRGKDAAIDDREIIKSIIEGNQIQFLSAGLGGGTGSGSTPVVAEIAKEIENCLALAVVTYPFSVEGGFRRKNAREGLKELQKSADTVIVIDNDRLEKLYKGRPVESAFKMADEVITTAITSIAEMISLQPTTKNAIKIDYQDFCSVMEGGNVAVLCMGQGKNFEEAVQDTIRTPLLEVDYAGATGALILVTGGPSMKLGDTIGIGRGLTEGLKLDPDANIIWGIRIDENKREDDIEVIAVFNNITSNILDFENENKDNAWVTDDELGLQAIQSVVTM